MAEINQSKILTKITCNKCSFEKTFPISKHKNNSTLKCPQPECHSTFTHKLNCVFDDHQYHDISPDAFTHPLDRAAISALRKIPGFDFALRKMMEYGYEKILRVNSMAADVKVTANTCSYIHDMVLQASKCIGISVPDVFINQEPYPNAFTFGIEYPIISIQSGLIELVNEDELYAVIAHEMAHIKCHHVLYHMLADFLVNASGMMGLAGGFIIPLNLALLEWSRKAELSADRGALIVTNNKSASVKLLMKLAGGSAQISEMIDEAEFVKQAEQFEQITKGISLTKVYRIASNITKTHPFPVLRAYEINKWADGKEYKSIFEGYYQKRNEDALAAKSEYKKNCPHCGESREENNIYCPKCGQNTDKLSNQYDKTGLKTVVDGIKGGVNSVSRLIDSFKGQNVATIKIKICPKCKTQFFDPNIKFCMLDGTKLIEDRRDN